MEQVSGVDSRGTVAAGILDAEVSACTNLNGSVLEYARGGFIPGVPYAQEAQRSPISD